MDKNLDYSNGISAEELQTVMKEMQGRDNDGIANSITTFRNVKLLKNPKDEIEAESGFEMTGNRTTYKPEVRITSTVKGIILDFVYQSALDVDISILYNQLELYGKAISDVTEMDEILPDFELEIVPQKYNGAIYLSAHTPYFWCLQPEIARDIGCNMIRIFFENQNVCFMCGKEIDISKEEALKLRKDREFE